MYSGAYEIPTPPRPLPPDLTLPMQQSPLHLTIFRSAITRDFLGNEGYFYSPVGGRGSGGRGRGGGEQTRYAYCDVEEWVWEEEMEGKRGTRGGEISDWKGKSEEGQVKECVWKREREREGRGKK